MGGLRAPREQILEWMDLYGERAGELTEDVCPNLDSDTDPICMGTYSIKMRLRKNIPQLIPMWGKRIRVYHRGVQKLCNNCYGPHPRRNFKSEKVPWTRQVLNFMEKHPQIPKEMYGRWWKVINDEFGEIIEDDTETADSNGTMNMDEQHKTADSSQPSNKVQEMLKHQKTKPNGDGDKQPRMTREEEEDLAVYLDLSMLLKEAREQHKKELEVAEIRMRIRDNVRQRNRGSVEATSRTTIGPLSNYRGSGRGGLSFNLNQQC